VAFKVWTGQSTKHRAHQSCEFVEDGARKLWRSMVLVGIKKV